MPNPWGIIVRPTERGHALLFPTPGFSTACVPSVRRHRRFTSRDVPGADASGIVLKWVPGRTGNDVALPLWWDNTLVADAYDRARRVAVAKCIRGGWSDTFMPDIDLVLGLAEALERERVCDTVLLDRDQPNDILRERVP